MLPRTARRGALLGALLALAAVPGVRGHALAPSLLELRETGPGRVRVVWRTPLRRVAGAELAPVLPEACGGGGEPALSRSEGSLVASWEVRCPGGLAGRRVAVRGLAESRSSVLVRAVLADGRRVQRVLREGEPGLVVPHRPRARDVARDYGRLGVEHIAGGLDHLAFVLGLVLLLPARRLVGAVTAFTAGHSLTLALAALGHVRVPSGPAEAAIAASVLAVAAALRRGRPGALERFPAALTAGFGLVHGLGFAGALAEAGLPDGEIPLALAAFNVGIEIGQLAFVAAVVAARALAERLPLPPGAATAGRVVPAYAIGALAGLWLWERLAGLL